MTRTLGDGDSPSTRSARLLAVTLLVGWWPMAVGEALYGTLDDFDLEAIATSSDRFATAAIIELAGAIVLFGAVAAMIQLGHNRAPALTWIGAALAVPLVVSQGAFAQLHLMVLEMAAPNLDRGAMSTFVEQTLAGFGLWSIPTLMLLVGMTFGLPILTAAVWRAGHASWLPVAVVTLGAVVHLFVELPLGEVAGHALIALGLSIIGVRFLFRRTDLGSQRAE